MPRGALSSVIRPLEREDLPGVAALYESVMRSGPALAGPKTTAFLERTLLDHPWADPEIPSLVYEDAGGRVAGFLGSHVRRLRLDGEPVRAGWVGHVMSAPQVRRRGVGVLLLRRYLAGAQDLTATDTAGSEAMRGIWLRLGGRPLHLANLTYTRPFRPWQAIADRAGAGGRRLPPKPVRRALDAATLGVAGRYLGPDPPSTVGEPLTVEAMLAELPAMTASLRLYPDYDGAFLSWLWSELERVEDRGRPVRRLVRDQAGTAIGWYVYLLKPGGISHVLHVAGTRGAAGALVDDLFHHAHKNGSAALHGRIEPLLLEPVGSRRCLLLHRELSLVHSGRSELLDALGAPHTLLTRMEGDWWLSPPQG